MCETLFRRSLAILIRLMITSLATWLVVGGFSFAVAEDADTTQREMKGKRAVEIEIGDEGIIVREPDEKESKTKKIGIIFEDEKISLDGRDIDLRDLDTALKAISLEGGSIIKIGEPIFIPEDEVVDGDLVSIGGAVTIAGTVSGDVAVIAAPLYVKSTGIVKGDVATIGGKLHQDPGAEIRGQRVGVGPVVPIYIPMQLSHFYPQYPLRSFVSFGAPLIVMIIFSLLMVALVAFFAPKSVHRIHEAIQQGPVKSFFLGVLAIIVFMPLFIILLVTIIGIPVALIIQPIAYSLAIIMGFAGVSLFVGTRLDQSSGLNLATPLAKMLVGTLAIELGFILAWVFTLGGRILAPLFGLFIFIGCTILFIASMAGLGATAWTRFGRRSVVTAMAPTPQTPPPTPPKQVTDDETPEASVVD